ncbi:hypothetical protein AB0P36_13020 [Streptomyces flavidovirens]|uniref:hypothetical protein n=1 Tax=Streptomyces flavidovirens TaxID=67298 RepID=UPI003435A8A2
MSSALQGELGLRVCLAADTASVRVDLGISEFEAVGTVIISEDGLGIPRESVNAALLHFSDMAFFLGLPLSTAPLGARGGASYDR